MHRIGPTLTEPMRSQGHDIPAYLVLFCLCLLCVLHVRLAIVDDGFIAHRYAANLVHGYGLVFTRGERVEGVSDLSWTLLMTVPQFLGWRPELFAVVIGFVCSASALMVAYRTAVSRLAVSPLFAFSVLSGAAINADYWLMATNGIESGLYALVLITSLLLLLQGRILLAGGLLGFATTLRPESVALAPIAVIFISLLSLLNSRVPAAAIRTFSASARLLFPWAVVVLSVLAWRLSYYGEWLPNTVIAKMHPFSEDDLIGGLKYLVRFTGAVVPWAILCLFFLFRRKPALSSLGLCWGGYQVAVTMINGGDWMPGYRLLIVYLPVLALLSASALDSVFQSLEMYRKPFVIGLLGVCCALQANNRSWTISEGILRRHTLIEMVPDMYEPPFINLAKALKPGLRPDDVLSSEVLGVFGYELLDSKMHDWLGLVDSHIAHHGTVYYPRFGKAEPDYSVDVVRPALFAFDSGEKTLEVFQTHTGGRFGQAYSFWRIGKLVTLALRHDREQEIVSAIRNARLPIQPILAGTPGGDLY